MLFPVLLVFLSCKKLDNAVPYNQNSQVTVLDRSTSAVVTEPQTPTVSVDSLAPANAVSVKKYGATGLGLIDDSNALQNAINAENTLVIPKGVYIISKTLNMRPGVKIYGTDGAIIKASLLMSGTLLTQGWFFLLQNDDNCSFINLELQSARTFKPSDWFNSCIFVQNSKNTTISYNYFNFSLPYAANGVNAVWVTGDGSTNTIIKSNQLKSVGIEYAEAGANGTIVDGNTIDHAPSDGICGHGNTDTYCAGNVIMNNIVTNSGMMGIEDWGKIDGTIIKNNKVTACGKDPKQHSDGMGISAVGVNSFVLNNVITDAQAYYIECYRNNTIQGNVINDTEGTAVGIIANYTSEDQSVSKRVSSTHTIANNTVNGCNYGVYVYGDFITADINIASNTVNNPVGVGVNIDNNSNAYRITVSNNNINFTVPNSGSVRKGCETYTTLNQRNTNQVITFNNNTINFANSANGGNGLEKGFWIATDNTVLNGNKVYGNNIKGAKTVVSGLSGNTDPAKNISLIDNMVSGATVDLSDFSLAVKSGNNF